MNETDSDPFESLYDALKYVGLTSGLYINETLVLPRLSSNWPLVLSILPLILGLIGLIFNILALLIFTASKTFRENSFRCYIYAFVLLNCASILTHSWFYLLFYLVDPIYFCKYLQYFQQAIATTLLWIMVLLSFERSLTFSRPFTVKKFFQPRPICLILIFLTFFCFAIHIDELISVEIEAFRWVNFAYGLCSVNRYAHFLSIRTKIVTHSHSFILPFTLNCLLDIYICYKICQRRQRFVTKSTYLLKTNLNKKKHQRFKKSLAHEITLTLLCQSLWLLVTYFPRHLYYFLISFNLINDYDRDNSILSFLLRLNLLIYLAFSPALYVILSPTLRREIRFYLCLSYQRQRQTSLTNMSYAHEKLRQFLFLQNRQQQVEQQRTEEPMHLTIVVTASERPLRKSLFEPTKCEYISKSVPCLIVYNDQDDKLERSITLPL